MDLQLNDRVALLVGGAGSIGQAVAGVLSAEGARVLVADQSGPLAVDVTRPDSVAEMIAKVLAAHGRIDILVCLVGVYQAKPAVEISSDEWRRMLDVNLHGTFLVCRDVLPHMQRASYGRIIALASLAGQVGGVVAGAHYAASKAGVLSLVKSLARQAAAPGVTINAVSPGPVESQMTAHWPAEDRQRMLATIPAGRFAHPEEIADVIAFLASPRAAYIHGARIDINGGAFMA
jgi:NAD(P)-dependent dehydrogenase (short-subunit alcohol dehydrogenase family)